MGRLEHRLKRLEQRVKGRHSSLWQVRLARMSYEELMAEVVKGAVQCGMPEEQALRDPDAAEAWLGVYLQSAEAALAIEERDEITGGEVRVN